ncbi:MAG: DUF58 domain-containing protein [Acidimicrobiia bacterium]|nr:DUF58 domain-containing protein [Acidimicrobiia bacterium]
MDRRELPVHASARDLLARVELTIARRLDGLLQGDYRGLLNGQGSELGETRPYQPGDDVRRIDWNVTARTDAPHTRDTIADRELETWLAVDLSPSLDFGTARCTKRELAVTATAAIGFLTARTGNRFGLVVAGGERLDVVAARSGRPHLLAALHRVADTPPAAAIPGRTDLAAVVERLTLLHRRRGLAVVVSDFLAPEPWAPSFARLAVRHDVLAIEIVDPRELELPDVGSLFLVDPETGRSREVHTSAKVRARYQEAATAQRDRIAADLRRAGVDHLQLRTDRDWLDDLVRFVELRRQRLARAARPRR